MEEADRGGQQRHVEEDAPERLPGARQAPSGEEGGAAADDHGEQEEDVKTVVGEPAHRLRSGLGRDLHAAFEVSRLHLGAAEQLRP